MNKNSVALTLALVLSLSLSACNSNLDRQPMDSDEPISESESVSEPDESAGELKTEEENTMLAVYFSCTGTTKQIAEYASEFLGADLYEIVPQDPYTDEDLSYYTGGRADQEQDDPSARPAISGGVENMEQYDTVLIGYPIWHGQAPKIISTFLESYDFSGKTVIPFCTSHSSGIGASDTALHAICPDAAWMAGERFSADSSKAEMEKWFNTLGVTPASSAKIGEFNFETRNVLLNSGYVMPINGLGTYSLHDEACVDSVTAALNSGVRLIDTAHAYGNEKEVGEAIRASGIPREDIFVITKLYPDQFADPVAAINEALEELDIGYIDMMLLHHPGTGDVEAYLAMEQAAAEGKRQNCWATGLFPRLRRHTENHPRRSFFAGICKRAWWSYRGQAIPAIFRKIRNCMILNSQRMR